MRQALEAVGLPMMPQFRRIGGMLADEVPIDDAALHAAILAINEALDNQVNTQVFDSTCNFVSSQVMFFKGPRTHPSCTAKHQCVFDRHRRDIDPQVLRGLDGEERSKVEKKLRKLCDW
jgi:hypothetical protein